jgi:hypothetical protein
MPNIGLLNEKSLHASLKVWYAQPGDQLEVPVDGFVIDIVRDGLLLEIQTGNFSSIKSKLRELVRSHQVRLIYPIAQEKWIVKQPKDNGDKITRRKSPKIGRVEDLFREMVRIPDLILNPNFSLEVLLIKEEEERRYKTKGRRRRKGWATEERRLLEVIDKRLFENAADLQALLPGNIGESFTTKDFVDTMGIRIQLAQKMAFCLRGASVIELIGKQGRYKLYGVAST